MRSGRLLASVHTSWKAIGLLENRRGAQRLSPFALRLSEMFDAFEGRLHLGNRLFSLRANVWHEFLCGKCNWFSLLDLGWIRFVLCSLLETRRCNTIYR